jgi:hypothetical protein
MLKKIFATHRPPSLFKTGKSQNMVSQGIANIFIANEIKHFRVTPCYPQAAGYTFLSLRPYAAFHEMTRAWHISWRFHDFFPFFVVLDVLKQFCFSLFFLFENFNKTIAKCIKTANNVDNIWREEIFLKTLLSNFPSCI